MHANADPQREFILIACAMNLVILLNVLLWAFSIQSRLTSLITVGLLMAMTIYLLRHVKVLWPLLLFIAFGFCFTLMVGTPDWDARSIWLFHAKRIFFDGSLFAQLDNYAPWSHNDYPIVFPALAATLAKLVGHWNEAFPKSAVIFLLVPSLLMLFSGFQKPLLNLIFLIGLGMLSGIYLLDGTMDVLVGMYAAALIVNLMRADSIKNTDHHPYANYLDFLVSFSSFSILMLLKNEGLAMALVIACALVLFLDRPSKIKCILSFSAALLFYFFVWKWHLIAAHIGSDLMANNPLERIIKKLSGMSAINLIASNFFMELNSFIFVSFVLIFFRKTIRFKDYAIPIFFVFGYSSLLFFIYLSTPYDLAWHLGSSLQRTFMAINIVALCAVLFSFNKTHL